MSNLVKFDLKDGFNAALPAMGLVLKNLKKQSKSMARFQCCFACNGFSITLPGVDESIRVCFNAALPAMGLVFYNNLNFLWKNRKVSMLLCLQWV